MLPLMAAAQLRFHGRYTAVEATDVDYVLLYDDLQATDAYLETTDAPGTYQWERYDGTFVSNADALYPEHNEGYRYRSQDTTLTIFVLEYKQLLPTILSVKADCDATYLTLSNTGLSYRTPDGATHALDRRARFHYTTLAWDGTAWADSVADEEVLLSPSVRLSPVYRNTTFAFAGDDWSDRLGCTVDTILSDEVEAIAVSCHPVSITTKRGETIENEPSRPIQEDALDGSAPLAIQFLSNPTPTVQYFRWEIYKGSTLLASRTDQDERYTFTDYSKYQVKLWCYNDSCQTDSTVFDVSISASMLRVPNVFTPNGDGQNEEFRVMYRSLAEFHCWIYNRWGHLVYEWHDPSKGWNGRIGGRPAAEGTYYYVIRARGTDAEAGARYHKVTKRHPQDIGVYQLSGHVNLIR